MNQKIHAIKFRVTQNYQRFFSKVNESPTIILGNQKSGTSAIVSLLGEAANKSYSNDIFVWHYGLESKVFEKKMPFEDFVDKARYHFSKDFIKDPSLTFMFEELSARFPNSKYVFVIRNPLDNIRSILNRLQLPGDLKDLDESHFTQVLRDRPLWMPVITGQGNGWTEGNYIERLAHRCRIALELCHQHPTRWITIRYEDFVKQKHITIENTLKELGIPVQADISSIVDKPFQPKGDTNIAAEDFFSPENIEKIIDICGPIMHHHGYAQN